MTVPARRRPRLAVAVALVAVPLTAAAPAWAETTTDGPPDAPSDDVAPIVEVAASREPNGAGWYDGAVDLRVRAWDEEGGSGVASLHYRLDGGPALETGEFDRYFTFMSDGVHTLEVWAEDHAGNVGESATHTVKVDRTMPAVAITRPLPAAYPLHTTVYADYACTDSLSGLASCVAGTPSGERLPTHVPGDHEFVVTAADHAGNTIHRSVTYTVVDMHAPTVDASGPEPGESGWFDGPVTVSLFAEDDDLVASVHWRTTVNGTTVEGSSEGQRGEFVLSESGRYEIEYWAVDRAGNASAPETVGAAVDLAAPTIDISSPRGSASTRDASGVVRLEQGQRIVADYVCSDAHSGIAECVGSIAKGEPVPTDELGRHELTVRATDRAGHSSERTVEYEVVPADTPSEEPPSHEPPSGERPTRDGTTGDETGELAVTGAPLAAGAGLAALLLLGGVITSLGSRRNA